MSFLNRFQKLIYCLLFVFIIQFSVSSNINTCKASTDEPITYSSACVLMEQSTGAILYSKNANAKMYPASTTKIMTAILTLENCELSDVAVASHNAIFSVPVRIFSC